MQYGGLYKNRQPHVRKHYARILAVHGPTVDRRTRSCLTADDLRLAVDRQVKAMRQRGPYLVEWYHDGERVNVTLEG
jgi:hypothetical protein